MRSLKKYALTLLIGGLCVFLIIWAKEIFAQTEPVDVFHILCDAFFAVGVVMTGVGLLIYSVNEGTFDMLVYGMDSFFDTFRKKSTKKYATFYDYRMSRADKKIKFGFLPLCGSVFLVVSIVMYLLYLKYSGSI